jgi:hypothetical protein
MLRYLYSVAARATLVAVFTLIAFPVFAHHSFAMFDVTKELTLDGTVREFQWTNPHSWLQLTVMENGQNFEYSIEGQSPNGLVRHGWTKKSLKPGDKVKVIIRPLKDGSRGGSFERAIFPDGRVLEFGGG